MVTGNSIYEGIELIFDKIVYSKHPEVYSWDIDEDSQTLLVWIDTNKVDFTMSDIIDFETYYLLEEEYDHFTSDYFYDIITCEVTRTVNRSFDLIGAEYKVDFIFNS